MSEPNVETAVSAAVAAYWREITGPQGVFSHSPFTLMHLYRTYDRAAVDAELQKYIDKEHAATARRDAETVRAFYASHGIDNGQS
jgi:hypothetical protein